MQFIFHLRSHHPFYLLATILQFFPKYVEGRPDNVRGTIRPAQTGQLTCTRPKMIESKVGVTGQKITCEANYFRLTKLPGNNWKIYQYRVDFSPDVESIQFRRYLLNTHRNTLGGFLFDGTVIYLTKMLEAELVERTARGTQDDTTYVITFRFTTIIGMTEMRALHVLNLILRRAMDGLHLETIGRNKFDADAAVCIHLRLYCFLNQFSTYFCIY